MSLNLTRHHHRLLFRESAADPVDLDSRPSYYTYGVLHCRVPTRKVAYRCVE